MGDAAALLLMPPAGALIFKLEQTFFSASVDYHDIQELIRKEQPKEANLSFSLGLSPTMIELKRRMGKRAYEDLRRKAEIVAGRLETQALGSAQMHPGAVKMLEAVRDTGWWVVAASDFAKRPISGFLENNSLGKYMNLVVARSRLDEEPLLAKRLQPVQVKLKTLANSVYFCNRSREVTEAKALGMKCFVLPSPVEPFRTLYQAGPTGIILSLEEIPTLLSLPTMKLPEIPKPSPIKRAPRRTKKPVAKS